MRQQKSQKETDPHFYNNIIAMTARVTTKNEFKKFKCTRKLSSSALLKKIYQTKNISTIYLSSCLSNSFEMTAKHIL